MIFVSPQPSDILGGRGKRAFSHQGNINLRSAIAQQLDTYKVCTSRKTRSTIVQGVINDLQVEGARFLKFDTRAKQWYDAGVKEARLKVMHAFRDASIPNKVKCIEALNAAKNTPVPKSLTLVTFAKPPPSTSLARFVSYDSSDLSSSHDDDFDEVYSVSSHDPSAEKDFENASHMVFPCQIEFEAEVPRPSSLRSSFPVNIAARHSIIMVDDLLKDLDESSFQASTSSLFADEWDELLAKDIDLSL
eukprot:CAMPEP_0119013080 /NCGR_PEP_ID=MMETSP1176-20130426/7886_1 /TAXON_ID=265551 /ORGANISM="Synedropsis recta cf, Strain CCMP1620" /LENGTH=246 /DNA_ID=CAMNT_0006966131 /DNA_START=33 /DNA_END=773 /DNA_ORIENTATION=-